MQSGGVKFLGKCLKMWEGTGQYRGADKSLAQPTSLCILFDG